MKTKRFLAALIAVIMVLFILPLTAVTSLALNSPNDIKSVALTLETPKAGATVDLSYSSVSCDTPMDYKVVGLHWYKGNNPDYLNDRLGQGSNDKYFIGNCTYTVKIELAVKGDKTWNMEYVNGKAVYHINATVNGQAATVGPHELNPDSKTICVTYVFENIPIGEFIPYVSVGTPVAGMTKNDITVEPYNARQMRLDSWGENCNWYARVGGEWVAMEADDTFAAGKEYRLIATFNANKGFRFSASGTHTVGDDGYIYGYVNGRQMSMKLVKYADQFLYHSVTFTYDFVSCEAQELDSVSFDDIQTPVAGQHPEYTVTMKDDTYSLVTDTTVNGGSEFGFVNGLSWADSINNHLNAQSVFETGKTYILSFFIKADDIYRFSDWVAGSANVGYVNVQTMFDDPTLAFVTVEFAPCGGGVITEINVGDVTEPVNGAKPDYDFTYGQGYDKGDADPSIVWVDLATNEPLTAEDTFKYGHTYELLIIVRSDKAIYGDAGEFEFAPIGTLNAKINGKDVGVIMADPNNPVTHYVQLAKTFECAKAPVPEVSVRVENPLEGNHPAQQIELNGDTYKVEGFMITDHETNTVLMPDSVYAGAKNYSVIVKVVAKEGYEIGEGITDAFINDQKANVLGYDEDSVLFMLVLMSDELPFYGVSFSDGQNYLTKEGVITLPAYEGDLQENEKFVGWTVDGQMTYVGEYYINKNTEFVAVIVEKDVHKHVYDNTYIDNGQGFHEKRCIDIENCDDPAGSVISEQHRYENSDPCAVICLVCKHERTTDVGFGYHNYKYECSEVCPTCGKERETTHAPGADATCTEAQTCTVCKKVLTDALGHTAGEAANCAHAQTCTTCGIELAPIQGEHIPGAAATCTEAQKCTVCQSELAPAKGHVAGVEWMQDETAHWHICAVCSGESDRAEHADANGDARCDVCGENLKYGLGTGAIIAIVVGSVAVLGGGGFCLYWFVFRKKKQ